jgi:uncharacterized protein YjbI with pentapeptide repeats
VPVFTGHVDGRDVEADHHGVEIDERLPVAAPMPEAAPVTTTCFPRTRERQHHDPIPFARMLLTGALLTGALLTGALLTGALLTGA